MPRGRPKKIKELAEEIKNEISKNVVPVLTISGENSNVENTNTLKDVSHLAAPEQEEEFKLDAEEIEEITTPCEQLVPAFGSEKWQEYVMVQFKESELDRGAPKCDGLRRVLQNLVGPIAEETVTMLTAPCKENDFTSTVAARVIIEVTNESHPFFQQRICYDDVADTNRFNTDAPYHKFPSATSLTRAQGRIFRKMLGLTGVYAAEEVSDKAKETPADWEIDAPINDGQITVIDNMCKRLDLSVIDFINSGKLKYNNIYSIGTTTAGVMIQELNKFQQGVKEKPPVNKYDINWKNVK